MQRKGLFLWNTLYTVADFEKENCISWKSYFYIGVCPQPWIGIITQPHRVGVLFDTTDIEVTLASFRFGEIHFVDNKVTLYTTDFIKM